MSAPLAGLRVLDLTSGPAGGLATMILGDFGATVIRFVDAAYDELNQQPSARMWLRGKVTATRPVHDEVKAADVLVITRPNGFSGCDFAAIHRINPALIYAELSAFGDDSALPVSEPVVAARMGRMKSMEGIVKAPGPRYAAVQVATHAASQNLVTGILAALHERSKSGSGQMVKTSLGDALTPYDQGASLTMQVRPPSVTPTTPIDPSTFMPTLNYHPVQCADGRWLQLGNLMPHLFENFMRATGLTDLMQKLPEGREEVRDAILLRMQERTLDEWMTLFIEDGSIAAHPYQSAEAALTDPDMVMNGHVVELGGVKQLGPVARLTATPATIGTAVSGDRWTFPIASAFPDASAPLRGITVIELAAIIASPLAASFLADLGARVIKVEPVGGDPYRGMNGGFGANRCNQGKESIGIDLKSSAGQAIVHELVATADIVIHNFRPGVPERLGISYAQLKAVKPDIIYLSANGYGPDGPSALRPSTHPIPGAAMGGAAYQAGGLPAELLNLTDLRETARRIMRANEVNPDPNTAMVICTSAMLGLLARERTGKGQQIFGDMLIANAYANFDDCITFAGKPVRAPLLPDLTGVHALRRLYRCQQGWVFLGIDRARDWQTFCQAVNATHLLAHYPKPGDHPEPGLNDELAQLLGANTATHWENLLLPLGVGCVVADQVNLSEYFFEDSRGKREWMVPTSHTDYGTYYRHRPMIGFSRSQIRPGSGTAGGAHTRALMQELGRSAVDIDALYAAGVLWTAAATAD